MQRHFPLGWVMHANATKICGGLVHYRAAISQIAVFAVRMTATRPQLDA
jgi:hypothetical protein